MDYYYSDEKRGDGLPVVAVAPAPAPKRRCAVRRFLRPVLAGLLVLSALSFCPRDISTLNPAVIPGLSGDASSYSNGACAQPDALAPKDALWSVLGEEYGTDAFRTRAIDWLGGAVRVPTESYDKMKPVGEDPRWEPFAKFQPYLATAFPQVVRILHKFYLSQ
jgi:Gly-Xaa carboxypeptidase